MGSASHLHLWVRMHNPGHRPAEEHRGLIAPETDLGLIVWMRDPVSQSQGLRHAHVPRAFGVALFLCHA
jgi:hypothetical protein